ncbi:hypothetical protein AWE51_15185 [Aquimarina aggregata]|uniref:Lipoprotein n=1 Tax=Aquimarina aggregata TaxID=1642818 RepID=A0A162Y4X4_9FLAO|nr:hypothetical protein [Aquimarina aggregata]KZS38923.1 hypothetical protein AWE51_15185 [Aquimarina aggregata]
MENATKIILLFIFTLVFTSCKNKVLGDTDKLVSGNIIQKCENDERLYTSVNTDLLYKNNLNKVYLKRRNEFPKDYPDLNECQKLPYAFIEVLALKNDSIVTISSIIDVESFSRFVGTDIYFYDKNRVYTYNTTTATYPNFYEIELDKKSAKLIDSFSLKDKYRLYKNGMTQ